MQQGKEEGEKSKSKSNILLKKFHSSEDSLSGNLWRL